MLSQRFSVSVRTIQRDIDALSSAGIPITSSQGPTGGYSLLDSYTLSNIFFKKEELKVLTDLLSGMEKLLKQVGFSDIKDKMNAIKGKDTYLKLEMIRFEFTPWLPQHELQEKLICMSDAIVNHRLIEINYRDQRGGVTYREIEPYQLVMKDNAWYVYGYCLLRNEFRYFKVIRIEHLSKGGEKFYPRNISVEDPFTDLKDKLISIKLKFSTNTIGRIEDYFPREDINYFEDRILVQTQYPDDCWLYQTLLSFGKDVEVIEPVFIRKKLQNEAQEMLRVYSCDTE